MTKPHGVLYVVATPIGNLDDLSPRAVRILQEAALVLTEDTRAHRVLAGRFSIATPAESFHEHNERQKVARAIELLQQGASIALVSEAGTPTISDPGYRLVKACHDHALPVRTVPGPCAAVAALSISGFETDRFYFAGFLPQKAGRRTRTIEEALRRECATIFYESPHRIVKTMTLLAELAPTRDVFIGRELTKLHEETLRGAAAEVHAALSARPSVKGEIVLIVRRSEDAAPQGDQAEYSAREEDEEDQEAEPKSGLGEISALQAPGAPHDPARRRHTGRRHN